MDELEKRKLIVPGTRRVFARNLLTVIKPADSRVDIAKPADLADARWPDRRGQPQERARGPVRGGEPGPSDSGIACSPS